MSLPSIYNLVELCQKHPTHRIVLRSNPHDNESYRIELHTGMGEGENPMFTTTGSMQYVIEAAYEYVAYFLATRSMGQKGLSK